MSTTETAFRSSLTLGERLALARKRAGHNQLEFAEMMGMHRRSVVNYENDEREPKFALVCAWAKATGAPLAYFADATLGEQGDSAFTNWRLVTTSQLDKYAAVYALPSPGQKALPFPDEAPAPKVKPAAASPFRDHIDLAAA